MKLLRIGKKNYEKPAILNKEGKIIDIDGIRVENDEGCFLIELHNDRVPVSKRTSKIYKSAKSPL